MKGITKEDWITYINLKEEYVLGDVISAFTYEDYTELSFEFMQYMMCSISPEVVTYIEIEGHEPVNESTRNTLESVWGREEFVKRLNEFMPYHVERIAKEMAGMLGTKRLESTVLSTVNMGMVREALRRYTGATDIKLNKMNQLAELFRDEYDKSCNDQLNDDNKSIGYKIMVNFYDDELG